MNTRSESAPSPLISGHQLIELYASLRAANQARTAAEAVATTQHRAMLAEHALLYELEADESELPSDDWLTELGRTAMRYGNAKLISKTAVDVAREKQSRLQKLILSNLTTRTVIARALNVNNRAIVKVDYSHAVNGFIDTGSSLEAEGTISPSSYMSVDQSIVDLKPSHRSKQLDHYQITLFDRGDLPQVTLQFADEVN